MKKLVLITAIIVSQFLVYSCTPEALRDTTQNPVGCCGDDGELTPPPPPPPPPDGDDN